MWERNENHQVDALNPDKLSHMRSHMAEHHLGELQGVLDAFGMKKIKACSSALSRQIREALEIASDDSHNLLNLKEEYNR